MCAFSTWKDEICDTSPFYWFRCNPSAEALFLKFPSNIILISSNLAMWLCFKMMYTDIAKASVRWKKETIATEIFNLGQNVLCSKNCKINTLWQNFKGSNDNITELSRMPIRIINWKARNKMFVSLPEKWKNTLIFALKIPLRFTFDRFQFFKQNIHDNT